MKKLIYSILLLSLTILAACGKNNESGKSPYQTPTVNNPLVVEPNQPDYQYETSAEELFGRINERRAVLGISPLVRDSFLDTQAHAFAVDLGDGRNSEFHLKANLCDRIPGREACAFVVRSDIPSAGSVVGAWLRNDSRREKILDRRFRRSGVAMTQDRSGRPIWVLVMLGN